MRGSSLADLSRKHGLTPDACRLALVQQWPRAERIIADFLGVPAWELWPDRYTDDHRPTGPRREQRDAVR